jgi:hypothetical protein
MWPASLRQGITTLTLGEAGRTNCRAGDGRAMMPNISEKASASGSRPT